SCNDLTAEGSACFCPATKWVSCKGTTRQIHRQRQTTMQSSLGTVSGCTVSLLLLLMMALPRSDTTQNTVILHKAHRNSCSTYLSVF
ncbi:mCG1036654, partial [Mus musculus]